MFKLTNRHNKQVILLVSYILHVIGHYASAIGLLISAAGGPGKSMTSQNFISAEHLLFDVYNRIISNLHLIYYKICSTRPL